MKYLCVLDTELANQLTSSGARVLQKRKDVNGYWVWTFDTNAIPFDISDAVQSGKAFFSTAMRIAFQHDPRSAASQNKEVTNIERPLKEAWY